jgi:hypothetical protein
VSSWSLLVVLRLSWVKAGVDRLWKWSADRRGKGSTSSRFWGEGVGGSFGINSRATIQRRFKEGGGEKEERLKGRM